MEIVCIHNSSQLLLFDRKLLRLILNLDSETFRFLSELSASTIDLEIRELQGPEDVEMLIEFLEFSISETENFELIQTMLFLLLKVEFSSK
jgi:hypothetical protein